MKKRGFLYLYGSVLSALVLLPTLASAQTGPVYPLPNGDPTFSTSGNGATALQSSGKTNYYSGIDPTNYATLFWTFTSVINPTIDPDGAGPAAPLNNGYMRFDSYNSSTGISTWISSANLSYCGGSCYSYPTKLLVQFAPLTFTSGMKTAPGSWIAPTTLAAAGITPTAQETTNQSVIDLTGMSGFQVWYQFQTAQGVPLGQFYDATLSNPNQTLATGTSGAFYYTAATPGSVTPEPVSMTLLGTGLLGIAGARRRRKKDADAV